MSKRKRTASARHRTPSTESLGEVTEIELDKLLFDSRNPRLPENVRTESQDELLRFMASNYEPIEIARSIANYGFFPSEPLIVLREKQGNAIVVEGNRRLAALRLLDDPELASRLDLADADEWSQLAGQAVIDPLVPVVVASSRRKVTPIIGYRHISGIQQWDPWAKARFIAQLVDEDKLSFDDAASEVGEREKEVRVYYRNHGIVRHARDKWKMPTEKIEKKFGVFTRLMQDSRVAKYVGVTDSADVAPGQSPLPTASKEPFGEIILWSFGDETTPPLFTDSRQIGVLGTVVGSKDGIKALRMTHDLSEAYIAAGGVKQRCLKRLTSAAADLSAAVGDLPSVLQDEEVLAAVQRCSRNVKALQRLIEQG